MKKLLLLFLTVITVLNISAQNVGVGTNNPSTNLEVKNPLKSVLKISSNSFQDSSQVILSNRTPGNLGTDMLITNIREEGIRISSSSDLSANNTDTIMQISPRGLVGIRVAVPAYPLDVNGDINLSGAIRANGTSGENGQFLRSNGDGTMSWEGKESFRNFRVYRNNGSVTPSQSYSFVIPSGVSRVGIEMWGGGGNASNGVSGGSGGYIFAIIPSSLGGTINLTVGAGGGCSTCTSLGETGADSRVFVGSVSVLNLIAQGGSVTIFGTGYSQGTFFATGSSLSSISYFGIEGGSGMLADLTYENNPSGGFFQFRNRANGGDSPTRPGTGGKTGWAQLSSSGLSIIQSTDGGKGSEPGGGGGFPQGKGGHGQVIVYW